MSSRKQNIIINGQEVLVFSDLLEKDINGLEYPNDCYQDTMTDGIYLKSDVKINKNTLQDSINEAQTLLKDTDFYVIRKMEESIEIPADVATARAEAKQLLRDNNITYTLGA